MIIVGAKGFAKEVLAVLSQKPLSEEIFFYDDISDHVPEVLYNKFKVLRNKADVVDVFSRYSKKFTVGLGDPVLRYSLAAKFTKWGGEYTSTISPNAHIGQFGVAIGRGVNLMTGSVVTCEITIEEGALINLNCTIGHDTFIGKYSVLLPGVHISGRCRIGKFCKIGSGAVLLPDICLGMNVIVGAGALVTKDVADNSLVVGVPGKIVKSLSPLDL